MSYNLSTKSLVSFFSYYYSRHKVFSPKSVVCLFIFLTVYYKKRKFLILMNPSQIFFFLAHCTLRNFAKSVFKIFSYVFFQKFLQFQILNLGLDQSQIIFRVWQEVRVQVHLFACEYPIVSAPFQKDDSFPLKCCDQKPIKHICIRLFFIDIHVICITIPLNPATALQ